jgi:hypothetical protein
VVDASDCDDRRASAAINGTPTGAKAEDEHASNECARRNVLSEAEMIAGSHLAHQGNGDRDHDCCEEDGAHAHGKMMPQAS